MNTWPQTNPPQQQQPPLQPVPPATATLTQPPNTTTCVSRPASVHQGSGDCGLPQQQRQRREDTVSHQPARVASHHHPYQRYQPYHHQHHHHQQQQYQSRGQQGVPQEHQFGHPVPGPSSGGYPSYPGPSLPQYYRQFQGPAYDNNLVQQQPSSSNSGNSFVPNYQYFQYLQQYQASAAQQQQYPFEGYQQPSYQQYQTAHPPQEQLSTLEGVQSGVPTLTTPTLTPTTLRNIQQTFFQATASSQPQPPETHTNQAGFVPPFVHPQPGSTFISIDSKSLGGGIATLVDPSNYSSTSNDYSGTLAKTTSGPPPLLPISDILTTTSAPLPSSSSIPTIIASAPPSTSPMPSVSLSVYSSDSDTLSLDVPPSRRMGGRRPNNHEKLSEEEEVKRRVRRERNKMAAARCRKRRLDQTMTLQEETDHLSEKRSALQQEVTMLTQQKEELEFLLATHKAVCTKPVRTRVPPPPASSVIVTTSARTGTHTVNSSALPVSEAMFIGSDKSYMIPSSTHATSHVRVKEENLSDTEEQYGNSLFSSIIPTTSSLSHVVTYSSTVPPTSFGVGSMRSQAGGRPNRPTSLAVAPLTELGVSIETPSAGLRGLNFESMMEGGTGLTPVTPLPGMMPTSLSTGLTPLTTPIMPHPSASNNNNNSSTQCGYQQRSSSSELSSPDSMSSKQLVSL